MTDPTILPRSVDELMAIADEATDYAVSGDTKSSLNRREALRDALCAALAGAAQAESVAQEQRTFALQYCDQVERQIMEVANGERKSGKIELQPIGRLIEYIRNGKTFDVTLTYKAAPRHHAASRGRCSMTRRRKEFLVYPPNYQPEGTT